MKKISIILFGVLLLNIYLWSLILLADKGLAVYFLDVGQGDASVIQLPGRRPAFVMIDSGADKKALSLLPDILFGNRIDLLALTHEDKDHSGGAPFILDNYKVTALVSSGLQNVKNTWPRVLGVLGEKPHIDLRGGDKIRYGDSVISVLHPKSGTYGINNNANSLVLLFESEGVSFLFTGDIDDSVERDLIKREAWHNIDVLKVAHHGSKYGSTDEFLKLTDPEISVIGVGKNYFGHPTDEVLSRLANVGSLVFRSDKDGSIKIYLKDGKLVISSL